MLLVLFGTGALWTTPSRAQSSAQSAHVNTRPLLPGRSEVEPSPSFGRVLLGSTVGVGVGTGVGVLLIKGAAEAAPPEEDNPWNDDSSSDAAAAMTLIGAVAIVAGGPVGAVKVGGIERRRDAYVTAGFGEVVLGVVGYVLASRLHPTTTVRLMGLGAGAVVGAAGGAYMVASRPKSDGLFSYQDGRWQVGTPEVRVRPNLVTDRAPSVGVALVSIEL